MNPWYTDFSQYMTRFYGNRKIQKISVSTGGTCPNRDGTKGRGGCIYCNNTSFTPTYCLKKGESIREQIRKGRDFFARKYPHMEYIAYFQAYSSTYGLTPERLGEMIEEALSEPGIVGIAVGTRPDCFPAEMISMLSEVNRKVPVFVELGVETMHDSTLRLINRGHDSQAARQAILDLAKAGLHVGVHLIAGLPSETEELMLATIDAVCSLPIESIKLHHMQVLRGTPLHTMTERGELTPKIWEPEEYMDFCIQALKHIPRHIAVERFTASAPGTMLIAPRWGLKNHEFTSKLLNKLKDNPPA